MNKKKDKDLKESEGLLIGALFDIFIGIGIITFGLITAIAVIVNSKSFGLFIFTLIALFLCIAIGGLEIIGGVKDFKKKR